MMKISSRPCDVLIIGGGSAGLRAAIEAHDVGSEVLVVSKSRKGDPHAVHNGRGDEIVDLAKTNLFR